MTPPTPTKPEETINHNSCINIKYVGFIIIFTMIISFLIGVIIGVEI